MEREYKVCYGHKADTKVFFVYFVTTKENAALVAKAIAKGECADWCTYIDLVTGEEVILWDCM